MRGAAGGGMLRSAALPARAHGVLLLRAYLTVQLATVLAAGGVAGRLRDKQPRSVSQLELHGCDGNTVRWRAAAWGAGPPAAAPPLHAAAPQAARACEPGCPSNPVGPETSCWGSANPSDIPASPRCRRRLRGAVARVRCAYPGRVRPGNTHTQCAALGTVPSRAAPCVCCGLTATLRVGAS